MEKCSERFQRNSCNLFSGLGYVQKTVDFSNKTLLSFIVLVTVAPRKVFI